MQQLAASYGAQAASFAYADDLVPAMRAALLSGEAERAARREALAVIRRRCLEASAHDLQAALQAMGIESLHRPPRAA